MSETEISANNPEVAEQAVETHEKKSPQDSFAELRKAKEDLERQLWQAEQEKKFFEKQLNQQQQFRQAPPPVPEEEEFDFRSLEQEDFPDGKKLVKAFNSVQKKMSGYEAKLAEKENVIRALQIQQEFPDFREVVTADNIEKYIKSDEDNREAVETARDPLRKVYNLIRKSAAYQADKAKVSKPVSQEQQRVDSKEGKPKTGSLGVRSEAVTTAAQLSNSQMTREQRTALWKETVQAAKK